MPALHIRNRNDLIEYVINHAPYKAIERALLEGEVENYGAFSTIVAERETSGWKIRVKSKTGKEWILIVLADGVVAVIDLVMWENWIGDHRLDNILYAGDHPEIYRKERDNEQTKELRTD